MWSERAPPTSQLALSGRERRIMRRRAREPDTLVQVLRRSCTRLLDSGGSLLPEFLVQNNANLYVIGETILVRENDAGCSSIFDSQAGSLGLMRLIRLGYRSPSSCVHRHREGTPCPNTNTRTVGGHTTPRAYGHRSSSAEWHTRRPIQHSFLAKFPPRNPPELESFFVVVGELGGHEA